MPRLTTYPIKVPPLKPDKCCTCPFLGIIPKEKRKKGSKKTRICLAEMKAISKESITISEASRKGTRHLLHRPCDHKWESYLRLSKQQMGISVKAWEECRVPYLQSLEYVIDFDD